MNKMLQEITQNFLTFPDGNPDISRAFSTRFRSSLFWANNFTTLGEKKSMIIKFYWMLVMKLHTAFVW